MKEWLLILPALWVMGLFVPMAGPTVRDRAAPDAAVTTILSGFLVVVVVFGTLGVLWVAAAVVTGVLGLN